MRRVRSKDTSPEIALRKAVWRRGLRYRLHCKELPGRPDLMFASARLVVFVDGDFWHGGQYQKRGFRSLEEQFEGSPSAPYWVGKITRNMERDAATNRRLKTMGWRVIRVWESELKAELGDCVERIVEAVRCTQRLANGA